jgi:hypothetical protein
MVHVLGLRLPLELVHGFDGGYRHWLNVPELQLLYLFFILSNISLPFCFAPNTTPML